MALTSYNWRKYYHTVHLGVVEVGPFINIRLYVSQTQQNFIMFIIVLGQHVSILIESSSGPSKKIDPYLEMFKMRY